LKNAGSTSEKFGIPIFKLPGPFEEVYGVNAVYLQGENSILRRQYGILRLRTMDYDLLVLENE
jgi:hypothetical protein